jgi:hypothetical protein
MMESPNKLTLFLILFSICGLNVNNYFGMFFFQAVLILKLKNSGIDCAVNRCFHKLYIYYDTKIT